MKKYPDHIDWGIKGTTMEEPREMVPNDPYPGIDFEIDSRAMTLVQLKNLHHISPDLAGTLLAAEIHCKNRKTVVAYLQKIAGG